jgi:hypothetical protein
LRLGPRRIKRPAPWYRGALERLKWTAFRPGGRNVNALLLYAAGVSGVLVTLVTRGRSPLIPLLALALAVIVAIAVSAWYRWTWPWQEAYVREGRRSEAALTAILGDPIEPAAAEAWFVTSPDAPVADRIVVLGWLGRLEEADRLIATMPTATPLDRYRREMAEAFQRWRLSGRLDVASIVGITRDLDPSERDRAEATVAFWRGVAEVGGGGDLRDVPPPGGARLPVRDQARLWLLRLWPLQWMAGTSVITWVALGLLGFVVGR